MSNALNWFEIPTIDIDRAAKFYGAILATEIAVYEMYPGFKMATLPYAVGVGVGGAIVHGEGYKPSSSEGTIVYLNGGDDLSVVLSRVAAAGGTVTDEKVSIGENGFVGFFIDTEGNKVGLHSNT